MALYWEDEIANAAEFDTNGTLQGRMYADFSRTNNTISVTGIRVGHKANASGTFDDWEWYANMYCQGSLRLGGVQTKGRTGSSVLTGIWYEAGSATHSFGVGTGSGTFSLQANWYSNHWGTSSALRTVNIGYPAAGAPTVDSRSADTIEKKSARIVWTTSVGAYCTFSTVHIEYGLTGSYGSSITGRPQNGNYTLTNLKPGTTYYYRIYVANGAGLTAYSSQGTFKTKPQPSFLPMLLARK